MKYLVACNWDPELIDRIDFPEVSSLFAGLPDTPIASGRPSAQIRPVAESAVRSYIAKVHAKKWTFDYNMNSTCLANQELTHDGFKAILKYVEKIAGWGVDALTVSNTNLIGIIKKNFPHLKINVSTFQKVSDVSQARRFEDLGVDLIMLSEHINRDFKTLQAIRNAVKCQLALIANVGCIYDCPNALTHPNSTAHAGTKGERRLLADPFMIYCFGRRLESPEEVIKIRWIRPEDVAFYEGLGIDMLKIIDRTTKTEYLAERVKAYCDRKYDGNLLGLLGQMIDFQRNQGRTKELHMRWILTRPGLRSLRAARKGKQFSDLFTHPLSSLMYLDSKSLPDNFLSSFADVDCRNTDCRTCNLCGGWATRVVRVQNESLRAELRERLAQALADTRTGESLY